MISDRAMVKVGYHYIESTGSTFWLRTGDSLPMPPGHVLREPNGATNWNDRYALYVAEFLAEKYQTIRDEVEAESMKHDLTSEDWKQLLEIVHKERASLVRMQAMGLTVAPEEIRNVERLLEKVRNQR